MAKGAPWVWHMLCQLYTSMAWALKQIHEFYEDSLESFKAGAYLTVFMAGLIRGHEGFYLGLAGLIKHIESGKDDVAGIIATRICPRRFLPSCPCGSAPPGRVQRRGGRSTSHQPSKIKTQSGLGAAGTMNI